MKNKVIALVPIIGIYKALKEDNNFYIYFQCFWIYFIGYYLTVIYYLNH